MKICPNCNQVMEDEAKFCSQCAGTLEPVTEEPIEEPMEEPKEESVVFALHAQTEKPMHKTARHAKTVFFIHSP